MRRLFIGFVIAVFLAYCWASVAWQNRIVVPDYRTVTVSLTGGKTPEQWDSDAAFRNTYLEHLASRHYQPLVKGAPPLMIPLPDGSVFPWDQPLTKANLEAIVKDRIARGAATDVELRDPAALYALASQHYRLRDPLRDSKTGEPLLDQDGKPWARGGEPVNKAFLDRLIDADVRFIHIVGNANPISPQPGTIVLVALIFLALVAALQGLYWKPLFQVVEERKREIDAGVDLAKSNQTALARLEGDRARRLLEARRARRERIQEARAKARAEADAIIQNARDREHALKQDAMIELRNASEAVRERLRADIPRLAREIARQILDRDAK